jgi:hypothetical protein
MDLDMQTLSAEPKITFLRMNPGLEIRDKKT